MSYKIHNFRAFYDGEVQITNTLNVTGTANLNAVNVTGNLDVLGNISLNGNNIVNTDGSMEITGTAQLNSLNVTGNTDIDGTLNVEDATTLQSSLDVQGTAQLNALNVTGNTDIDGTLNVEDATTLQSSLNVQGTAQLNALNVTGNAVFDNDYIKIGNINMGHENDVGIVIPYIDSGVTKFGGIFRWQGDGSFFTLKGLSSESLTISGDIEAPANFSDIYTKSLYSYGNITTSGGGSISTETNGSQGIRLIHTGGVNYIYSGTIGTTSSATDLFIGDMNSTTATSNRKFMIKSDGNVGIGTSAPSTRLHVYENTTSTGTSTGLTIEQDGTGDAVTQYLLTGGQRWVTGIDNSDSDKFKISSDADLNTNNRFTITTDGNVGIGITNPTYKLDIVGSLRVASTTNAVVHLRAESGANSYVYFAEGGVAERGVLGYSAGSGDLVYRSAASNLNAGTERLRIKSNGNVGIGTTNPSQKLDVDGDINTSTNYDIGGTLVLSSNTLGGGVVNSSLTSVGTLSSLNVSGPITLNVGRGDVYLENNANDNDDGAGLTLRTGSNPTNGSVFSVRSSGQYSRLWIGTNISSFGKNPFLFGFSGTDSQQADTTKYNGIINSSGNVGIGTTNPSTRLHVYENTTSTGTSTGLTIEQDGTGDAVTQYLLTGGQRWVTGIDNSDSDKFKISSNADLNTNNRFTITTDGNVGINTTNPSQKLEVAGQAIFLSGDKPVHITKGTNNTSSTDIILNVGNAGLNQSEFIMSNVNNNVTANRYFALGYTADSTQLNIRKGGNVGIGTTQPSDKLHVVGGNILVEYGNYIGANVAYPKLIQPTFNSTLSQDSVLFYTAGANAANESPKMALLRDGNLGIGTTNPVNKLDIVGNLRVANTTNAVIHIRGETGANNYLYFAEGGVAERGVLGYSAGSGDLVYRSVASSMSNGTQRFRITSGGNVGIYANDSQLNLYESDNSNKQWHVEVNGGNFGIVESGVAVRTIINTSGYVGIGTTEPTHTLEVNGTFNVTSNNGQSGLLSTFTCEANGAVPVNTKLSFGGGSTSHVGVRMIRSGVIIGSSIQSSDSKVYAYRLYKNGAAMVLINVGASGPGVLIESDGTSTTHNLSFVAGDKIYMQTATNNAASNAYTTPNNLVGQFIVKYD